MQKFIGFDAAAMAYNRQYTISDARPAIGSHHDAIVCGCRPMIGGDPLEELFGGAFDAAGGLIGTALQPRSDGRNGIATRQEPLDAAPAGRLPRAVFGGVAFDHFGHFLLESTARLWALPEYRTLPWLFITHAQSRLKPYQLGFLELLGLPAENVVAVPDMLAVDELIVPDTGFTYHHHVTHEFRDTFRRASLVKRKRRQRRIFLSRSQTTIAMTVGEHELEAALLADGWDVVVPERLPPLEQAMLFHDDNIVVGLQGSAMHLGLFAPPGRKVVHLCRGHAYRGYYVLDDLMEADATYFQAMSTPLLTSKPINGPFMLDLDATLSFLRDEGLLRSTVPARALVTGADRASLERDYEAWWHFTESQTRFHRLTDHDGRAVVPQDALAPALRAVDLRPLNSVMMSHAAALLLKFEGAEAAATLLDRREPETLGDEAADAQLLYLRSIVEDMRANYTDALSAARRAQEIAPSNPAYVNQVATVLFRLDRQPEAEALLDAMIAEGRAVAPTFYLSSVLREQRGDLPAALVAARLAFELDRADEELSRHLVHVLRRLDLQDEAWETIEAFLQRSNGSVALLLEMARHDRARGRARKAMDYLRRACRQQLDHAEAAQLFEDMLSEQGTLPDLSALGRLPNGALREQSVLIYRRSLELAEAGQMDEAVGVAAVAAGMFPDNETIMQSLLGLMLRSGRTLEARILVTRLLARGYDNGAFHYILSLIESDLGLPTAAASAARRAAELAPDNETIVQHHVRLAAAA